MNAVDALAAAALVFWDFDGVIKESLRVKTDAFVQLFTFAGTGVTERVRVHHEANGGMSRFDKIPIYLGYAGEEPETARVEALCDRFGDLVRQGVIESAWVPGVEAYLRTNPHRQTFVVVSATPTAELEEILRALDLTECFAAAFGAPTAKADAIGRVIAQRRVAPADCLMIGDARADLDAALANGVPFLLRRHDTNAAVFAGYDGPSFTVMT